MSVTFKPLDWAGDTIVEVLIVVVVIGVVLASSYGIAVNSLQSMQLVQERGYALKVAEGQLENLKQAALKDPTILANTNGFCLDASLAAKAIGSGSPTADYNTDDFANYTTNNCMQDPNGGSCQGYCYYYGIKQSATNSFTSTVRWEGPNGNRQQVQLSYKVYP